MRTLAHFAWQNIMLTLLVAGALASAVALLNTRRPWTRSVIIESVLSYLVLVPIGLGYLGNFLVHVVYRSTALESLGWADNALQKEAALASLGFSVLGLLAFRGTTEMRVAAVLGPACFLLAAVDTGAARYTDLLLPLTGFTLLALQYRCASSRTSVPFRRKDRGPTLPWSI